MSPEISLIVGAQAWSNWTSYEVSTDYETPSSAWRVEAKNPSTTQLTALALGQPIMLQVGSSTLLAGFLERKEMRRGGDGTTVSLSGRDLAGPLVDCTPPASWVWRNISLASLASKACMELGVPAVVSPHADASVLLKYCKAEPGETYWQVIERLAKKARLIPRMTPSGIWQLNRPNYLTPPVAELVNGVSTAFRGVTNVIDASYSADLAGRFSDVTVVGQAKGDAYSGGQGQLKGSASDPEIQALGLKRPILIDDGDLRSTAEATARARWEISHRQFHGDVLEYTVLGHGPSTSTIWETDQQVTVLDELANVTGLRWISALRFSRSREGTRSTLTLRRPNTLLPAIP